MKRPVRYKIRGIDIIPYLIILITATTYMIFLLASKEFIIIENHEILAVVSFGFFLLGVLNYFKKIHPPKGIDLSTLTSTDDIKISTVTYKSGIINKGNNISFLKFYFSENEVYMYTTNFLKIYEGPFIIKKRANLNMGNYYIDSFSEISKYEAEITIKSFGGGSTDFSFLMIQLAEKDLELMINKFYDLGYTLDIKL
ncbi:hypothetical protein [Chryseobacterium chendengshani]|uniref:hypothetical protein n=1 Tax=Chryseobacterium sp. LJ756 TaxID=2864113 RepID=UPI001C641382|nr:hypothetical protein [Chryseobacterium sp. LJ756]MBW7675398.1 hypothetical protein [Chryseobacterium sp. LJ756]